MTAMFDLCNLEYEKSKSARESEFTSGAEI